MSFGNAPLDKHTPVRQIGDPVLRMQAGPVGNFDKELRRLEKVMFEVMYRENGVGLAAPQIGISLALFVMDCDGVVATVANPELFVVDDELLTEEEGCLSVKGKYAERQRYQTVTVRGVDAKGRFVELTESGYAARCLQHEFDHLQGRLYCDPVK